MSDTPDLQQADVPETDAPTHMRTDATTLLTRLRLNGLATTVALVTSFAALFIAWDQARVMRAQQHGSVWPIIEANKVWRGGDERVELSVMVENTGVGPALVRHSEFLIDGRPASRQTVEQLFEEVGELVGRTEADLTRAIAPGAAVTHLSATWERDDAFDEQALDAAWDRVEIRLCYCSVFDRCWVEHSARTDLQTAVKSCPDPDPSSPEIPGSKS